ncbi:PREDICTED: calmodulin-binding protein 25-like [Ipomoea nil]|uniref:calmodulin-binding protein 25-like n=1 Tax=Ipomoea nil TaxID=35883 RepID=UPI000901F68F|nr:PREDICTED: calmodulin-binding protein 25-like [Ipomoea nil]
MASSENLMAMEPWGVFRPGFVDPWFADVFSGETEALTKVLQKSMSDAPVAAAPPVFKAEEMLVVGTPSASGPTVSGGSENETAGSKRRSVGGGAANGKMKKRKSRAAKRSTTTYITADAAHFRQMVQQVTGFKFGGHLPVAPILKPEPQRAVQRLQPSGACLPTLDTSAFLLDQTKPQPQTVDPTTATPLLQPPATLISPPPPPRMEADVSCASAFDLDFFSSFPTLESWKTVM